MTPKNYIFRAVVKYELTIAANDEDDAIELAEQSGWKEWEEIDNEIYLADVEIGGPDRIDGHDD